MFPTVRLMIAATLASVVALICGFGMFAVFHVGHEPLVRLPAATAPLQLVADNAARSTAGLTSSDVLDARFAVKAPSHGAEAASMPVALIEPRVMEAHATESLEAEAEPAPKPDAAEPEQTLSTTDGPTRGIPALDKAEPPTDDQADRASPAQSEPTFSTITAVAAAPPQATVAEPEPDIRSPVVTAAAEDLARGPAIETIANDPANPLTAPRGHTNPAAAPVQTANPAGQLPRKAAVKKPKRIHTVVRLRPAPRLIIVRYVRPRNPQVQYASTTEQGFGATQDPNFPTATPTQYGAAPALRVRYLRIVVRKTPRSPAGIGGPFVPATSR
jgi:hypothetical protein